MPNSTRNRIVAHRGGAALWPENSLEAIQGALALGVDGIEVDIQLTKDGVPVILHDETLDRTTVESGSIKEVHSRDLRDIRLRDLEGKPSSAHLPSLKESLPLFRGKPTLYSIELKNDDDGLAYEGIVKAMFGCLADANFRNEIFVHGFDWHLMQKAQAYSKEVHVGINIDQKLFENHHSNFDHIRDKIFPSGIRHFNMQADILEEHDDYQMWMRRPENQNPNFSVWTVNSDDDLSQWLRKPLWGIASDQPKRALELRG